MEIDDNIVLEIKEFLNDYCQISRYGSLCAGCQYVGGQSIQQILKLNGHENDYSKRCNDVIDGCVVFRLKNKSKELFEYLNNL
jgi:hypothetical protein